MIETRFSIAFFAGEFVSGEGAASDLHTVRKVVQGVNDSFVQIGDKAS
jgi:hypothetical protein